MPELLAASVWGLELVAEVANHSRDLRLRPPPVGYLACDHLIQYHPETEDIARRRVGLIPQDFRRTPVELLFIQLLVVLSLHHLTLLCLSIIVLRNVPGKSEVRKFDLPVLMRRLHAIGIALSSFWLLYPLAHVRAYLDDFAAQVAMEDPLLVEVADSVRDLLCYSENDVVW